MAFGLFALVIFTCALATWMRACGRAQLARRLLSDRGGGTGALSPVSEWETEEKIMAALSSSGPSKRHRKLLAILAPLLLWAPGALKADVSHETPKAAPQDPRTTGEDKRPGETLSERLNRNSGVIHPPAGVDPGIAVPAPDPNPHSTPVIPPPGTPGGNPSVQPK